MAEIVGDHDTCNANSSRAVAAAAAAQTKKQ